MNKHSKITRALVAAALAACFAGSGLSTAGTAFQTPVTGPVWLMSSLAAAICAASVATGAGALLALAGLAALAGGYSVTHLNGLKAIRLFMAAWQGQQVEAAQITLGAHTLLVCLALIFGALFFLMLYKRGFTGMAIMLLASMLTYGLGRIHEKAQALKSRQKEKNW